MTAQSATAMQTTKESVPVRKSSGDLLHNLTGFMTQFLKGRSTYLSKMAAGSAVIWTIGSAPKRKYCIPFPWN